MEAMHLDLDDVVEVREERGRIVNRAGAGQTYVVDDLLESHHREKPAGRS
jgi:hypothetical protein